MSRIERSRKNLLANCFRTFGHNNLKELLSEMYRRNFSKYSKNNTFNKDCKLQQKLLANFYRNFSKNMFNRNCLQKSTEVSKKFHSLTLTLKMTTALVVQTSVTREFKIEERGRRQAHRVGCCY